VGGFHLPLQTAGVYRLFHAGVDVCAREASPILGWYKCGSLVVVVHGCGMGLCGPGPVSPGTDRVSDDVRR
jgi:hypothetical protein